MTKATSMTGHVPRFRSISDATSFNKTCSSTLIEALHKGCNVILSTLYKGDDECQNSRAIVQPKNSLREPIVVEAAYS